VFLVSRQIVWQHHVSPGNAGLYRELPIGCVGAFSNSAAVLFLDWSGEEATRNPGHSGTEVSTLASRPKRGGEVLVPESREHHGG
jgi:hypothetical protein